MLEARRQEMKVHQIQRYVNGTNVCSKTQKFIVELIASKDTTLRNLSHLK